MCVVFCVLFLFLFCLCFCFVLCFVFYIICFVLFLFLFVCFEKSSLAIGSLFHFGEGSFKGCRMGRSDKVSLWYVALLINTRFRFFILE